MRKSNYDKMPFVKVNGFDNSAWRGYDGILSEINRKIKSLALDKTILVIDLYPGVNTEEVNYEIVKGLNPDIIINSDDASFSGEEITNIVQRNLTDDRVFGVLSCHTIDEFFYSDKILYFNRKIKELEKGLVVIYGVGASLVNTGNIMVYADLARWEIQQRYRKKQIANWKMKNYDEDILKKYKRGFFFEWRIADRHKKKIFDSVDYILDTNVYGDPKMITKQAFIQGIEETVSRPFRVVPFFDPGVWGGQWMKEVCNLDKSVSNYAWCFDCVPEENSLYLKYGDIKVEIPSIDIVLYAPGPLLGEKVHARFGTEFPIRFDFLDTMGGQNLSLQVHPITEYIQEKFGMHYTQDESYYILDAGENAEVYLGLKEGINKYDMFCDLESAERGEISFSDEKYVNKFPAKKHDHFLIPAGTVHCAGSDSMILEISATPYIFTFKLWDWDRAGLDGLPRPVHLNHGKHIIQWNRTTKWVEENLVNNIEIIFDGNGLSKADGSYKEERTGLHDTEFIETRRHFFNKEIIHNTNGGVNVLNLVEGEEAIVKSPNNSFEPFIIHYAESFIVPARVGVYTIAPYGLSEGKEIVTLKAFVRV